MKKLLLVSLLLTLCFVYVPKSQAQSEAGFAPKHFYVDLGIGVPSRFGGFGYSGYVGYNGYNSYRLPAFTANLQYGFDMFSAGLFLGYTHYGYKYTKSYGYWNGSNYISGTDIYKERTSRIGVGVSFSWHVWYFLNNKLDLGLGVDKLDLYVTALIGGNIKHYVEDDPDPDEGRYVRTSGGPLVGVKVGGKYYFLKNLGAFLEFGGGYRSISYATVGLALKF